VFDCVDHTSIKQLDYWFDQICKHAGDPTIPKILVGSKSDLLEDPNIECVSEQSIQNIISEKDLNDFFNTSSLENYNVLKVFRELSELMFKHHQENVVII
jgi:GTPase SAR1 family protein